ncbi:DUF948 domain-containing protein [Sporosarcina pasteurii]|uniref:Uncharacterized protein containing a divergent version of the methyl-accepting chemotaxis-like domain n=1 Tax=Sporosarcina pasteurii TaxID=1474 RepID=A0A380BUS9_SPOPA|nr:DUF948 domain-containing protein [Sporosarcina pasteurii]MDS9471258.1 DUF948 domain-containing protein [Sporosarcina pasteurii]QBQ05110.1 DUF948 domain-containing protein [Sporosarcina pasteurii]SUJ06474.1 Uncharacterized protein containing a divergent version of the methyl-accepting chemotaxis-like domain [Sporosarcina pasteurii]
MNFLLYASAAIAALALVIIAIFVIITYKSAKKTMDDVKQTVSRVETKVTYVTEKANGLLEKTNHIAEDAEQKLQAFEQLSKSAKDLEQTTRHLDASFQDIAQKVANPPEKERKIMEQASVVTETIARIYYGFKKENTKRQSSNGKSDNNHKKLPEPQKKLEYHE